MTLAEKLLSLVLVVLLVAVCCAQPPPLPPSSTPVLAASDLPPGEDQCRCAVVLETRIRMLELRIAELESILGATTGPVVRPVAGPVAPPPLPSLPAVVAEEPVQRWWGRMPSKDNTLRVNGRVPQWRQSGQWWEVRP